MNVKEHILNTAESLFNRYGYTAVGINLIRDEANVSKTTIYRHFGNKSGLIESVLQRRHTKFQESLSNAVGTISSAAGKLEEIVDWHFNWFGSENFKGCMFIHALAEFKGVDEKVSEIAINHKKCLLDILLKTINVGTPHREEKSELLMTFLEGLIIRAEFSNISKQRQLYKDLMLKIAEIE